MNREKLGAETYDALVDLRAEVEVMSTGLLSLTLHLIMNMPAAERGPMIDQLERSFGNRQMPTHLRSTAERQFFVDLSTAMEAKARAYAANLRLLTKQAEAIASQS